MERTFLKLFASKFKSSPEIFFADTQVSEHEHSDRNHVVI